MAKPKRGSLFLPGKGAGKDYTIGSTPQAFYGKDFRPKLKEGFSYDKGEQDQKAAGYIKFRQPGKQSAGGGQMGTIAYYKKVNQQPKQAEEPAPQQQQQGGDSVGTGFTPTDLDTGTPVPEPQSQGPDYASMFADQIASMQQMFQQSMQQQQQQYMQMQQAQDERMAALQQQMQQAMVAQQTRPEVAGVKMAEGAAGTPMQIARRGVTGAFGRRGMRISSLNV
jgi:hypothetical protein